METVGPSQGQVSLSSYVIMKDPYLGLPLGEALPSLRLVCRKCPSAVGTVGDRDGKGIVLATED